MDKIKGLFDIFPEPSLSTTGANNGDVSSIADIW